jgi:histidyl-tRNA synthetase
VLIAMGAEGVDVPAARTPRCFVVAFAGARDAGAALVRELRAAGVPADGALEERPLGAQLRMADRAGARFAAIIGEREAATGVVTLRRLDDGAQEEVARGDVVNWLMRNDGSSPR